MTDIEKLQGIIDSNPMFHGRGEGLLPPDVMKPFRVGEWLVCTDGHAMAGTISDESTAHVPKASVSGFCEDWMTKPLGDVALPLEDLRRLIPSELDEPPCGQCGGSASIICMICEGEGVNKKGRDCKSCFDGQNDCPAGCKQMAPVVIGSLVYNARILKRFLVVAGGEEFRFVDSKIDNRKVTSNAGGPLLIGSESWRVAIMPTRLPITEEMPRLVLEAKSEALAQ